jgi:hypothetical protein
MPGILLKPEINTETAETVQTGGNQAVVQKRLVSRLRMHVRDMDARIKIAHVEIREKQAAVGQLEKEKWALDREVDKIEELLSANAIVMAHPLAGAYVDRGVGVEIRWKHGKQRG